MVTVGQRGPLPHRKGRNSGEQHFTEQAHRQKNTRTKLLQNKTIILVSQVSSHTYSRYFAYKIYLYYIFIYFAAKYECIELPAQQRHLDLVGQCHCFTSYLHFRFHSVAGALE